MPPYDLPQRRLDAGLVDGQPEWLWIYQTTDGIQKCTELGVRQWRFGRRSDLAVYYSVFLP